MSRTKYLTSVAAVLLWQGILPEQHCRAQVTVQLPTFRVTGVSTTVVVPDRGGVYLGGVTSSSMRQNSFGSPFGGHLPGLQRNLGNRSFGGSTTSAGMWIGATIIDHAEIDRALLAEADQRRNQRRSAPLQPLALEKPERRTEQPRPATATPPGLAGESQRAAIYLARAEQAEANGQPQVAKIFYERIARHGNTAQRQKAQKRLASLDSAKKL